MSLFTRLKSQIDRIEKTTPSLQNKTKSVKQSVYVAVTSSGWYKGLPQKCQTSVKQRFTLLRGL